MIYNSKIAYPRNVVAPQFIATNDREGYARVHCGVSKSINNHRKNEACPAYSLFSFFQTSRSGSAWFFAPGTSRRRIFAHTRASATLDVHLDAQRCHWLNEQEAPNEIFLREFSPTRAGNALWRADVWIGMWLLDSLFSREMRLGVHTSSFIRRKPSWHTRYVYEEKERDAKRRIAVSRESV